MAFAVSPDPGRPRTAGERIDVEIELHDQALDAIEWMVMADRERIAALEGTVALLEALLLGEPMQVDTADLTEVVRQVAALNGRVTALTGRLTILTRQLEAVTRVEAIIRRAHFGPPPGVTAPDGPRHARPRHLKAFPGGDRQ